MKPTVDTKLDLLFLKKLKENVGAFILNNKKEYFDLQKRKIRNQKQLILTKSKENKLNLLNNLLSDMEIELFKRCKQIEKKIIAENKKSKFPITDYEIEVEILYYSSKIINRYKTEELDYVFEQKWSSIYQARRLNEPFEQILYPYLFKGKEVVAESCGTFRSLADSYLTIEEIVLVDNIWWDIVVRHQYSKDFKVITKNSKLH